MPPSPRKRQGRKRKKRKKEVGGQFANLVHDSNVVDLTGDSDETNSTPICIDLTDEAPKLPATAELLQTTEFGPDPSNTASFDQTRSPLSPSKASNVQSQYSQKGVKRKLVFLTPPPLSVGRNEKGNDGFGAQTSLLDQYDDEARANGTRADFDNENYRAAPDDQPNGRYTGHKKKESNKKKKRPKAIAPHLENRDGIHRQSGAKRSKRPPNSVTSVVSVPSKAGSGLLQKREVTFSLGNKTRPSPNRYKSSVYLSNQRQALQAQFRAFRFASKSGPMDGSHKHETPTESDPCNPSVGNKGDERFESNEDSDKKDDVS